MCITTICFLGGDVINFEINLTFLIKPLFAWAKSQDKNNLNIFRTKIPFIVKYNAYICIYIYIYIYMYGIHHWRILWSISSYRKLARAEFWTHDHYDHWIPFRRSDRVSHQAMSFTLRANFVQFLQFYCLLSVKFYFGHCLHH